MTKIQRSALVPYTPRQMFELVNNIEDYPRFLPWCSKTIILSRTSQEVTATIEVAWSGVHKSFTTCNHLSSYERMEMILVQGPFKHLVGTWYFGALGEHGCKVQMDLEFEWRGHLMDRLFQIVFNRIANALVEAFCKRAVDVYGTR